MLEDLGYRLRVAREGRSQTLAEAAADVGLSVDHLSAMESGDYGSLERQTYAKACLRVYSRHLGLDSEQALREYESVSRSQANAAAPPTPSSHWPRAAARVQHQRARRLLKAIALSLVVVLAAAVATLLYLRFEAGGRTVGLAEPTNPSAQMTGVAATATPAEGMDPVVQPTRALAPSPAAPTPTARATPTPTAAVVLGEAPPAAETTVQVLDGVYDKARFDAAMPTLQRLGYDIVNSERSRRNYYNETTVFYSPLGIARRRKSYTRATRVSAQWEESPGLAETVDIHVVVGRDWSATWEPGSSGRP